uniref:WAP four-disulfide core domain protein 12 isoform X5 n=1 Tax=Jaculus jaculus TaxID=51337 RepID=UPI001E1B1BD7|nr:WAP four-disulfide core domain protein 12 isoform X5 [Jaculus jaculus]
MKSHRLLVLAGLLVLVNLVAGDGVEEASREKQGVCPADNARCSRMNPPQCQKDRDCVGVKKCCHYHCGLKCVMPVETLDEGALFPSS